MEQWKAVQQKMDVAVASHSILARIQKVRSRFGWSHLIGLEIFVKPLEALPPQVLRQRPCMSGTQKERPGSPMPTCHGLGRGRGRGYTNIYC